MLFSVPDVDAVLQLKAYDVFHRELKIMGSFINPATQGRAVELICAGKIKLEPLIGSRLPLESTEEAFRLFGRQDELKIVIDLPGA